MGANFDCNSHTRMVYLASRIKTNAMFCLVQGSFEELVFLGIFNVKYTLSVVVTAGIENDGWFNVRERNEAELH